MLAQLKNYLNMELYFQNNFTYRLIKEKEMH